MNASRCFFFLVLFSFPLQAGAAEIEIDMPNDTIWYAHVDLEAMRNNASGQRIYAWFDEEIGDDIREDAGIDLNSEINRITAYSDTSNGTVVIAEGPLTKESRERLLALATLEADGDIDILDYKGMTYYHVGDEEDEQDRDDDEPLEDLEDSAWFSFAIAGKAIMTSTRAQLHALLDSGGKIAGAGSHNGALFILSADKTFVQAGMQAENLVMEDDDEWESNILRNTKQAAILVADRDGKIAIEARLVATDPRMAQALGGIVNGLISLQAFNSDLEPEVQDVIRNTRVEVKDNTLSINTVIAPEVVAAVLDD